MYSVSLAQIVHLISQLSPSICIIRVGSPVHAALATRLSIVFCSKYHVHVHVVNSYGGVGREEVPTVGTRRPHSSSHGPASVSSVH